MKKKWQLPFLLLLILGTVVVCRQEHSADIPFQHEEGSVFGTIYHVTYQCDSSLNTAIMAELNAVDASLSMFNPQSTISRLNSGESQLTDSLFRLVFLLSQQISQATDGAFDITVAPLVNAWGFGFKNQQLPDSAQVDSMLQFVGWQTVSVDSLHQLQKSDPRTILDCSAVAKGFGSDQVASMLRRRGIRNFMVEIGGEIVVSGHNPKGKPWSIGISKPSETESDQLESTVQLTNTALATSGNYRNFYLAPDGRKLTHTIDPRTGYPAQSSILSATVVAPSCAMADAFATSFMVVGIDEAKKILALHSDLKALLIYADAQGEMQEWKTENWPQEEE